MSAHQDADELYLPGGAAHALKNYYLFCHNVKTGKYK